MKLLLDARVEGRRALLTGLRAYAPMVLALAGLAILYVAYKAARGATLSSGLGAYGGLSSVHYSFGAVRHWTLLHFAELGLSVAVIPMSALILLTGLAVWRGTPNAAERAFVAVAATGLVIVVVQAAAFASRFSLRIEERNMFHVAPLLLLALLVWIERGLPRPRVLTAAAAAIPALLLLALPLRTLITTSMFSDTFGLIPLFRIENFFSGDADPVRWLMLTGGVGGALLFAFVPRRFALVLPATVAVYLMLASWTTYGALKDLSIGMANGTFGARTQAGSTTRSGQRRKLLSSSARTPTSREPRSFGRPSSGTGASPTSTTSECPSRQEGCPIGRERTTPARGCLPWPTPATSATSSSRATSSSPGRWLPSMGGLRSTGCAPRSGWSTRSAASTATVGWAPTPRTLATPRTVRVRSECLAQRMERSRCARPRDDHRHVGREQQAPATRSWVVHSRRGKRFVLPTPARPYTVLVHIAPTFSPAQFGQPDTRQLGAQVEFRPGGVRGE